MEPLKILILYGGENATKPRNELLYWLNSPALHQEIGREIIANKISDMVPHNEGSLDQRVESMMNWADKAIILFTPDHRSDFGAPNVLEEFGQWLGRKGYRSLLTIRHRDVKVPYNASGKVFIQFENDLIQECRDQIIKFINDFSVKSNLLDNADSTTLNHMGINDKAISPTNKGVNSGNDSYGDNSTVTNNYTNPIELLELKKVVSQIDNRFTLFIDKFFASQTANQDLFQNQLFDFQHTVNNNLQLLEFNRNREFLYRLSDKIDSISENQINVKQGDLVGIDDGIFIKNDQAPPPNGRVEEAHNVEENTKTDEPDEKSDTKSNIEEPELQLNLDEGNDRIISQIRKLRGRIALFIPTNETVSRLARLREESPLNYANQNQFSEVITEDNIIEENLAKLRNIEEKFRDAQITFSNDENELKKAQSSLLTTLGQFIDDVNLRITRLSYLMSSLAYSANTTSEMAKTLASKVGHQELKEEANMHVAVIEQLTKDRVISSYLNDLTNAMAKDPLSIKAVSIIAVIAEVEKRRIALETLVAKDRGLKLKTVRLVLTALSIVLILSSIAGFLWPVSLSYSEENLQNSILPLIGIPWPALVWSLFGSFASMILRFNKNPIHHFGEAVKWLITRPIQGLVLGGAFYLIIFSGLFSFIEVDNDGQVVTGLVLVLSFLIGFSDRFANSIFNGLIAQYTSNSDENISD